MNHNHITRDIKPYGECPGCDDYHNKTQKTMDHADVLPSMQDFKKLNNIQIVFQDFRGQTLEKAVDYANTFNWDGKNIHTIESINRSGTHIVRVWFSDVRTESC